MASLETDYEHCPHQNDCSNFLSGLSVSNLSLFQTLFYTFQIDYIKGSYIDQIRII